MLKIYRILSYLLLPFAAFFGLMALMFLMVALSNFVLLLPTFVMAATVIYVFASFVFLQKGIEGKRVCKANLKDLLKVNAYLALLFGVVCLSQTTTLLLKPALIQQSLEEGMKMWPTKNIPNLPTTTELAKTLKGMLYFMAIFSAILLGHIFITFKFLREYAGMFAEKAS